MCVSYVKRPHTKFDKNQPQSDAQTIMKFQFIRIQPKEEVERNSMLEISLLDPHVVTSTMRGWHQN